MTALLDATVPSNGPATGVTEFADLDLPEALRRAVVELGFTTPTAIQADAIPALLAGRDLVGVAQTGTGKTAAFGLPLLARVDPDLAAVQVVVLTPTRELALQVSEALISFAAHLTGVSVVAVYGGAPYLPQQRALKAGAQVVVGTPGRVLDHLERRTLVLDHVGMLVLDEADEMLQMGFAEDVDKVLESIPEGRQVALFSATMPAGIRRVADQHLVDPVRVAVTRPSSTVDTVRQTYAVVPHRHKVGALSRVLATSDADGAIVFVRTRQDAERVGSELVARGVQAAYLSGDVAQGEREKIVDRLRTGALRVLVATDVAARGLDVERIGLVVNYDLPRGAEPYVHRIGRTGRAGRAGEAITFVTPAEQFKLAQIERATRQPIERVDIPTPAQVSAHRVAALLARADERAVAGRLDVYRTAVATHLAERPGTDLAEMLAVLAALAVGDDGPEPRTEQGDDLDDALARIGDMPERARRAEGTGGGAGRRRPESTGPRYRVAVGHRDGVQPGGLVGALTGEGGLTGKDIGKIDIFGSFSLVDIPGGLTPEAFERLSRTRVAGRPLHIRLDTGPRAPHEGGSRQPHEAGPRRTHDADRPRPTHHRTPRP